MPRAQASRRKFCLSSVLRWLGIALGLSLILVLSVQFYRNSTRPGELVFERDSADVGQVPIGQQVIYRFPMRNAGTSTVTITKKTASAVEGC